LLIHQRFLKSRPPPLSIELEKPCRLRTKMVQTSTWGGTKERRVQIRVRIHSQNMTTAAKAHVDRKTFGHLSWRVATRRQSLSRAKLFSILWRLRYRASSWEIGTLRFFREGMHGLIPLSSRVSRYQSASYPRSTSIPLCQGSCPLLYFSLIFRWAD